MRHESIAVLFMLALGGCVGSAPPLPPDTTSMTALKHTTLSDFSPADQTLTCQQIADEEMSIADKMRADNLAIEGNRGRNQALLYVASLSVVTLPVALATVQNDTERKEVLSLYSRRDVLMKLVAVKTCPVGQP